MGKGEGRIATLRGYIANAEAKIAKWQSMIEEIELRQSANTNVVFAMKGYKSRFALLTDEQLKEKAWKDYSIDADELSKDEIIKAMLEAEFSEELTGVNGS